MLQFNMNVFLGDAIFTLARRCDWSWVTSYPARGPALAPSAVSCCRSWPSTPPLVTSLTVLCPCVPLSGPTPTPSNKCRQFDLRIHEESSPRPSSGRLCDAVSSGYRILIRCEKYPSYKRIVICQQKERKKLQKKAIPILYAKEDLQHQPVTVSPLVFSVNELDKS